MTGAGGVAELVWDVLSEWGKLLSPLGPAMEDEGLPAEYQVRTDVLTLDVSVTDTQVDFTTPVCLDVTRPRVALLEAVISNRDHDQATRVSVRGTSIVAHVRLPVAALTPTTARQALRAALDDLLRVHTADAWMMAERCGATVARTGLNH